MKITRISELTGRTRSQELPITEKQYYKFMTNDQAVQEAFESILDTDQQEFLMTGIVPEEMNIVKRAQQSMDDMIALNPS